ncbi:hypothetical protein O7626_29515 [Micromonospora sp. WMMD1102]|uniref:hypothetical protein n=1 Tax=Micromonospora sp. WMMD1102 TaxID=3016105 RepID=UPI00241551FF|nr:hypothetical protein [Micromonospora sp. WMMD1102]MDG4790013.1 hypothetical protein [Micromonospora sp. WMMD1102]
MSTDTIPAPVALTLFDLPAIAHAPVVPVAALAGQLREADGVASAVAGDQMAWFSGRLSPTPPPRCVSCTTVHVYRRPAGFLLACPVCFPAEVNA